MPLSVWTPGGSANHQAFQWLRLFTKPEVQVARWLELLEDYDIEVHHRPRKQHSNADALFPIPSASAFAMVTSTTVGAVVDESANTTDFRKSRMDRNYRKQLQESQETYARTKLVLEWVALGKRPKLKDIVELTPNIRIIWEQWDRLTVRDGILYRQ